MRSVYLRYRRWATRGLLTCGLLACTASGLAHGSAAIDASLARQGDQAELRMRWSLRDLRHLVEVDRDGDGKLTPGEVLAVRGELERELQQALRLVPEQGKTACTSTLTGLRLADLASVDVTLRFRCERALRDAELYSGLFGGSGHSYTLTLRLDDDAAKPVVLTRQRNHARLPAPATFAAAVWLWAGVAVVLTTAVTLGWRWRAARRR